VSIRSAFSKLSKRHRDPTLERAEEAYSAGRKSDAVAIFRALAEGGCAQAQLRLAQLYERGEGVLQNFVEAVRWFRGAAGQNTLPAMTRLGEIYLTGLSAPQTATPAALARLQQPNVDSLIRHVYP
jgi:TPR repeat protein